MANQKNAKAQTDGIEYDEDEVIEVPLSDIEVDYEWNSRGPVDSNSGKTAEIKASLVNGQDTPVILRPVLNRRKGQKSLFMVCGFTRYKLIGEIAEESKNKNPTIRAVVRDMTDAEALKLNLRENMARETLSDAALVFGIKRLLLIPETKSMTDSALGQSIGVSQAYAGQLLKIAKGVKPEILNDWRANKFKKPEAGALGNAEGRHTATVKEMVTLASDAMKDRQDEEYAKICAKEAAKVGPGSWKAGVIDKAKDQGLLFGRLVKLGAIPRLSSDFFPKFLGLLITIPTHAGRAKKADGSEGGKAEVTEAMRQEFYRAAIEAYNTACTADFVWPPPAKEPKAPKSKEMTPEEYAKKWAAKHGPKEAESAN